MRKFFLILWLVVSGLAVLYVVYLIGYNAGHFAGVLETVTAQFQQAFRRPPTPREKV